MGKITKLRTREIVDDFARDIKEAKRESKPPREWVVDFRNEARDGKPRKVYDVPLELLRYRKDNGRISSDVLSYERDHSLLDETSKEAQNIIEGFLRKKDPERTEELKRNIMLYGQHENRQLLHVMAFS